MQIARLRNWIADLGLRLRVMPTPTDAEAGVLVTTEVFDPELHAIGERWSCWAHRGESVEAHRWRLQLHLQTLQIAIEDDLAAVLQERRSPHA